MSKKTVTKLVEIPTWLEFWRKNRSNMKVYDMAKVEKVSEKLASRVSMWTGDITQLDIDAIVNAANRSLCGGGGVDGAIHRAAGPELTKKTITLAPCGVGEAKITGGYLLPAKYVIHTVGPQGEKPGKLKECYENSLKLAQNNNLRSIAFPCISTGVYHYPAREAAEVALNTVKKFLEENGDTIDRVIFCLFTSSDQEIYQELLQKFFAID
ncbi:macro domain-containing protein CT2219-like isoform X2 [Athalia rosae]|nr:macro domain-containing protein CT2219-like isoform X2 [Athalia rosae]